MLNLRQWGFLCQIDGSLDGTPSTSEDLPWPTIPDGVEAAAMAPRDRQQGPDPVGQLLHRRLVGPIGPVAVAEGPGLLSGPGGGRDEVALADTPPSPARASMR